MREIPTGVIGVGHLGSIHARILSEIPGSRLVGVYDIDASRGQAVARQHGTVNHPTLDSLLEVSEALVVAVPTRDHYSTTRQVLEHGCNALVEKPFTSTLEEADELIGLAEDGGLTLAVGHVERFNAVFRSCRDFLDRPRFVESLRVAPYQLRGTDVTVVLDLMIHDIDLVLGLVRSPVSMLNAVGVSVLSGSIDIANARLVFESGAVANITASRVALERKRRLRLFQRSGFLHLDLAAGRGEFLRLREDRDCATSLTEAVDHISLSGDDGEPLRLEQEAFLGAIRGEATGVVSGREGRDALKVAIDITRQIEEYSHVIAQDT